MDSYTPDLPDLFEESRVDDARFDEWVHTAHGGEVANKFIRLAIGLKRKGFKRYGAKAIVENLRFQHALEHGPDACGFKINNNITSRLARFAMSRAPELKGFFEVRELRKAA